MSGRGVTASACADRCLVDLSRAEGDPMKHARTIAVAAATAVLSLGAAPVAHADKPGSEPCAKQEQQVTKAEAALEHVTAVFAHQKTKLERLQEQLAAATTAEEQAEIQAKIDK